MKVSLTAILQSLRDIYDVEGVMPRFEAYVALMTGAVRGEALPLGVFSPMGKQQAGYLDALLAVGAEQIAAEAAADAAARLSFLPDHCHYRLLLVVVDVARNGWTERYLTDAEWRFENKYDVMHQAATPVGFDRWVTVQLWTDEEPSVDYIRRETQAAIFRAAHRTHLGAPRTLAEMIRQEGRALAFANCQPQLDAEDIAYSREVMQAYWHSTDRATCFTALYGDEIAHAVGYPALGLSRCAGFHVGLADANTHATPESWLHHSCDTSQSASIHPSL